MKFRDFLKESSKDTKKYHLTQAEIAIEAAKEQDVEFVNVRFSGAKAINLGFDEVLGIVKGAPKKIRSAYYISQIKQAIQMAEEQQLDYVNMKMTKAKAINIPIKTLNKLI